MRRGTMLGQAPTTYSTPASMLGMTLTVRRPPTLQSWHQLALQHLLYCVAWEQLLTISMEYGSSSGRTVMELGMLMTCEGHS